MTCAELRERLDGYARALLSEEETAALEAHVSSCERCGLLLESLAPELPEVAGLSRDVAPPRRVWLQVKAEIAPRGTGRRVVRAPAWMLAAAAVLLVLVSAAATALLLRSTGPATAPLAEATTASLEAQYASASADLADQLSKAKALLDPRTVEVIERNLRIIDSALAESRRALQADPRNRALEQVLVAVWRQKIDYLRRAAEIAPAS